MKRSHKLGLFALGLAGAASAIALAAIAAPAPARVEPRCRYFAARACGGCDWQHVDDATQRDAARALHGLGARWALVKGGHLRSSAHSPDLLFDGTEFHEFTHPRIDTPHDHGAGDTLSAAMASALAHGFSMPDAVAFGKRWVTRGLQAAYPLGSGHGPVNPLWRIG